MEAFATNLLFRTASSSTLQSRFLLLLPWIRKSRGICCSSEGTSKPSFPVRYIPKSSRKTERPQSRLEPIKDSDKKIIKQGLNLNSVRLEGLKKRTISQKRSASEIKPLSHCQGLANRLPNGSYREANKKSDSAVATTEDELEEHVEELDIQMEKVPLSHDLLACNDKENASIRLLATRDKTSDSSIPVQNVAKNSLKHENDQTSRKPVKRSDVKVVKKCVDPDVARYEVANGWMVSETSFFDNPKRGPASSLTRNHQEVNNEMEYDEETLHDEHMAEPEVNAKELGNYLPSPDLQACENKEETQKVAVRLLATRAYTAVELRKKLQGKRFPTSTIDVVVTDFQSRGLINDGLYAESYARSRWSSSSWGPRRVKQGIHSQKSTFYLLAYEWLQLCDKVSRQVPVQEYYQLSNHWKKYRKALLKKGVTEIDTQEALKLVYEDGDQDSSLGLSKVSMDQLYTQASKQWLRGQDVSFETRKSRIIRWLQYRGFNWGVTNFILKKLESKHRS